MGILHIFYFACVFPVALCSIAEEKLLRKLFNNYNYNVRPVVDDADTVNVTFGMSLSQIINVQEKNQMLEISAFVRQEWKNPYLTWEPKEFNDIKMINVNPSLVWKPDIVLYNNADEDKTFGGNLDTLKTRTRLSYDGTTKWLTPVILKSQCQIDVKYFPFDTQVCPLKFGSWTYNMKRLNLLSELPAAALGKYSNNSEWYLISASAKRNTEEYPCCPERYPDVTFKIKIARRSLFYLCNLIFPMTVIGMLTMLCFLLPAESGERVSLAITLLLAQTVFMLVVADIIPATSEVIPLVSIFFTVSMIEMVIMIVVLCYIMSLHHKEADDPPMSPFMRKYILNWLSYMVCIQEGRPITTVVKANQPSITINDTQTLLRQLEKPGCSRDVKRNSFNPPDDIKDDVIITPTSMTLPTSRHRSELTAKIDLIVARMQAADADDQVTSEWRVVAMTIDRCLLIVFAAIFFLTIIGCFSMSPGYVE